MNRTKIPHEELWGEPTRRKGKGGFTMYYVTTTDKFMSGWGKAQGKINKLVFECETWAEAKIVAENAEARSDQKNVNICSTKPHYPANTHYTQIKTKEEYPSWYKEGYFRS